MAAEPADPLLPVPLQVLRDVGLHQPQSHRRGGRGLAGQPCRAPADEQQGQGCCGCESREAVPGPGLQQPGQHAGGSDGAEAQAEGAEPGDTLHGGVAHRPDDGDRVPQEVDEGVGAHGLADRPGNGEGQGASLQAVPAQEGRDPGADGGRAGQKRA